MKILITGAAGYIGTELIDTLLKNNYEIVAIDRLFFGEEPIRDFLRYPNFEIRRKDSRFLDEKDLHNVDIVMDLVALSNDPSADLDPNLTNSINYISRVKTASLAKKMGVNKYVLASSCSVYGAGSNQYFSETSPTNPLTAYSKSVLAAEKEVQELASEHFNVVILRNATVFGSSRRMRFDLVVNLMVLNAFQNNEIIITGGGNQWRALIHVKDEANAFLRSIHFQNSESYSSIFNIGFQNFQIKTLAYLIREYLKYDVKISFAPDDPDKRNYAVNVDAMKNIFGFEPSHTIEFGINEIHQGLINGSLIANEKTNTVNWYKKLIEAEKLYKELNINGKILG